ncbi:MAG: sulfotransferase [Xanthobacteraceae bacterium]
MTVCAPGWENSPGPGPAIAYLLGVPRSGTTLLTLLLAQHPAVLCPAEPWLMLAFESLGSVPANHPCGAELIRMGTAALFGQSRTQMLGWAVEAIYHTLLSQRGKRLLIDKTPRYYHCLPFIKQALPQAKFVWIRRNPLDVAASYKTTWKVDIARLIRKARDNPNFFDLTLGFRMLADFADENDVCIVAYEDLVHNPQAAVDRIFRHLNLAPCDLRALDPGSLAYPPGAFGDQKAYRARSIYTTSIGRYLSALSRAELEAILGLLGRELFDRIGYGSAYDAARLKVGHAVRDRSRARYEEALRLLGGRDARKAAGPGLRTSQGWRLDGEAGWCGSAMAGCDASVASRSWGTAALLRSLRARLPRPLRS